MIHEIIKSDYLGYGIRQKGSDLYYCLEVNNKENSGIIIYDENFKIIEKIVFTENLSTGNVFCVLIKNFDLRNKFYKIFDGSRIYVDDFCESVFGLNSFGKTLDASKLYGRISYMSNTSNWKNDRVLKTKYSDSVFYITHPRGFTMLDEKSGEFKGTYKAIGKKAQYLKELGITGIILMPVYERIENEVIDKNDSISYMKNKEESKINYWGFGKGFYYSLKTSFCYDANNCIEEFKEMILSLHKKGIEIILSFDFVNENYEIISDVLRYWILNYHVDGFRIFGVYDINRLINDPFFKDTKIILENYFDFPNEKNILYKNISVFDDDFKNTARKFLKSDDDCVGKMSYFVRENHDNYASIRNITDFDGFSLYDLVSFDHKHNELNNEDNKDGTNYNYSWNCGEEGISTKKTVNKLRLQQMKNAVLINTLCQGTPVITSGDENLNTANGNNNPYCQDNEIGWTQWNRSSDSKEIHKFIKDALEFRRRHVILHQPQSVKLFDYMSCKLPDVSFHGEEAWKYDVNPDSKQFAVLYAGCYSKQFTGFCEDSIMIIYNMHWDSKEFALPQIKGSTWKLLCTTDSKCNFNEETAIEIDQKKYISKGRTITILLAN